MRGAFALAALLATGCYGSHGLDGVPSGRADAGATEDAEVLPGVTPGERVRCGPNLCLTGEICCDPVCGACTLEEDCIDYECGTGP